MSRFLMPSRGEVLLLVVDAQEKVLWELPHRGAVEARLAALVDGARALRLPTFLTEIAPDRFGPTAPAVLARAEGAPRLSRTSFAALSEPTIAAEIAWAARSTIIVAGVPAHVAVQQTALGALAMGYGVHVAGDAVGSREPADAARALERLQQAPSSTASRRSSTGSASARGASSTRSSRRSSPAEDSRTRRR